MGKRTKTISKIRKHYWGKLYLRIIIFIITLILFIFQDYHNQFNILEGFNFFKEFSVFHILWVLWIIDMVYQLIPAKGYIALGSKKNYKHFFKPIKEKINKESLKRYITSNNKSAYLVMILWVALISVIGLCWHLRFSDNTQISSFFSFFDNNMLLLISVAFYVFDLICVLIWCPFRLILRTKCCTTCRIFNWDHMMMFTPMIFVKGFYSISLLVVAFIIWIIWELCVLLYPERFWENSNAALKCSECTDKLCTQHCKKLKINNIIK